MSKTQEARDALAIALDAERTPEERSAALGAANELRKELSIGWGKLGAPEGFDFKALDEELRGAIEAAQQAEGDAEKPLESAEQPSEQPKADRGGIGRLVNLLLTTTDLDYASIVARVKGQYSEAKTTARSVASVAADLRRDGVDVPSRRKLAKAKAAE